MVVHFGEDARRPRVPHGLWLDLKAVRLAEAELLLVLGLEVESCDWDSAVSCLGLLDEVAGYVFWVHADGF